MKKRWDFAFDPVWDTYPEMEVADFRQKSADLLRAVSAYAKDTYGDSVGRFRER